MTSIIYCLFDFTRTLRHMSMASVAAIRRFTDDEDYELIIIDNVPKYPFRDDYKVLNIDPEKFIVNKEDKGYYGSLNQGAKMAKGDYLCFIQPDVIVHEGWLKNAVWYLENGYDAVFPDQQYKTREFVKASYDFPFESEDARTGARDAGILYIKREAFDQIGGWNEDIKIHFGERDIYEKINGLKWTVTCKTMITHLEHAAGWTKLELEPQKYNSDVTESVKVKNG